MSEHWLNSQPLSDHDLDPEVRKNLSWENPDSGVLKNFLFELYRKQTGVDAAKNSLTVVEQHEFSRWLSAHKYVNNGVNLMFRRWPRLQDMIFENYSGKIGRIAQRGINCHICHGGRPLTDLAPAHLIPIRIAPISYQTKKPRLFAAFKAAISHYFNGNKIDLGRTGRFCIAITFVINCSCRDKDLDNMTKALQDALANALKFNDRYVHHLDIMKLIFSDTEEYVYIWIAPSALNEHYDVAVKAFGHNWAGQKALNLVDFY